VRLLLRAWGQAKQKLTRPDSAGVSAFRRRPRAVELAQRERRAPNRAVAEPANRTRQPDGDSAVVNLGDLGKLVLQVAGADPAGEHHQVADAQLSDRLGRADGVQQLPAGVHSVGDRAKVRVKLSGGDGVQQLALRVLQSPIVQLSPKPRRLRAVGRVAHPAILAGPWDGL
jgi:hypothetical protein